MEWEVRTIEWIQNDLEGLSRIFGSVYSFID